jgi:hypothetical protein
MQTNPFLSPRRHSTLGSPLRQARRRQPRLAENRAKGHATVPRMEQNTETLITGAAKPPVSGTIELGSGARAILWRQEPACETGAI